MKRNKPKVGYCFDNMFSISNEELQNLPSVIEGQKIKCHICGKRHKLSSSKNQDGSNASIMYFTCGSKKYLASVDGKLII